jgi:hypothetical protein
VNNLWKGDHLDANGCWAIGWFAVGQWRILRRGSAEAPDIPLIRKINFVMARWSAFSLLLDLWLLDSALDQGM